jgi:hypothetical protein
MTRGGHLRGVRAAAARLLPALGTLRGSILLAPALARHYAAHVAWPWLRVNGLYAFAYGTLAACAVSYWVTRDLLPEWVVWASLGETGLWICSAWIQRRAAERYRQRADAMQLAAEIAEGKRLAMVEVMLRRDQARWS